MNRISTNRQRPRGMVVLGALLALAAMGLHAAEVADDGTKGVTIFEQDWATLDGGGGRSSGGTFVVTGTVGQHDADPLQPSVGGAFAVTGGFWTKSASSPVGDDVFSDGFEGP